MPAFDAEEMQLLQGLSEIPYLLAECIGLQISFIRLGGSAFDTEEMQGMSSKDLLAETRN